MKQLITLLLIAAFISSCSKEEKQTNSVLIRVKNLTEIPLLAVNNWQTDFGTVNPGSASAYKSLKDVAAYPAAVIVFQKEQTDTIYINTMFCGTSPLPVLESGKYTLEVFRDSSAIINSGFNSRYKKDE